MNQKGFANIALVVVIVVLVGAVGYLGVKKYRIAKAPSPSVSPTQTAQDQTAGWKTYTNTKYGFQFKYPSNWKTEESLNSVAVYTEGQQFSIMVGNQQPNAYIYNSPSKKSVNVDGLNVTAYIFPSGYECYGVNPTVEICSFYAIPVQHANNWYILEARGSAQDLQEQPYNQILSTFKFTKSAALQTSTIRVVTIKDIVNNSGSFLNAEVKVTGKLINIGQSYFNNPTFVLSDDTDNFLVSVWLPLEVPPPMPGSTGEQPPTMATYLDKSITLQGVVKKDSQSRFYLDVIGIK